MSKGERVFVCSAYEKAAYIVFSPIHEHTFTHSFIMKGVMGESFPPSHLSVKP
jgi:hypothetical protein